MSWLNDVYAAIGSIPIAVLPDGVAYWLYIFGVSSLVGGILTGITLAITIQLIKFFAGKIMRLINPLSI